MGIHRLISGSLAGLVATLAQAGIACGLAGCDQPSSSDARATSPEVAFLLAPFRPDDSDSDELFRFEPGHDVETYDGELVRVHFTRTGPDAVKLADSDGNEVPDAVDLVAATYAEVLTFFGELGFRAPVTDLGAVQGDGGDGRLDVYLIDFGGASDGAWVRERCDAHARCSGYVVQENDFTGYGYPSYRVASRILASHELFHAVQAAYDANQGANWSEATAVWASERFDPSLSDLESFADGWLEAPDRSIDQEPIGPIAAYSYGLGIFAQYLYERFGDAVHLELWDAVEDGANGVADPHWLTALVALLASDFESTFDAEWVTFAQWALRAGHGALGGPTFGSAEDLPRMARDVVTLPFSDDKLRVYATSVQVWSTKGDEVAVAIVSTTDGDTDGLHLVTGLRKGDQVKTVAQSGLTATLDGGGADEVIVAVVSTNLEGNSKRPGLCIGTSDDVVACVAEFVPTNPDVSEPGPELVEPGPEESPEESPEPQAEPDESIESGAEIADAQASKDEGCAGAGPLNSGMMIGLGLLLTKRRAAKCLLS